MTKNKLLKIFSVVIIIFTLFMVLSQNVLALPFNIDEQFEGQTDKGNATSTLTEIVGKVINAIQVVAVGIAILMIIVIALKWIYATPGGKVAIAKTVRYYVLGAILIFSSAFFLQIVKMFALKAF